MSEVNSREMVRVHYTADHRDGKGELISRSVSIQPPQPPMCLKPSCLFKYIKQSLFYALLVAYHQKRVAYAESNRHKNILERYRTGMPSPTSIIGAIIANMKLRCPLCRTISLGGK